MNKYFLPVYHSELKPWIKWWILKRLSGGESSLKAVTLSSGTLTKVDKSKALSITEYYGNTVQDGTPTPESPVEIQTISGDNTFTINGVNYRLDLGGKNLLKIVKDSATINGITFTQNEDGSIGVKGTATANATFASTVMQPITPSSRYTISGCPSGGSNSTYRLLLRVRNSNGTNIFTSSETGSSLTINVPAEAVQVLGEIIVYSGQTVDLTFYPQLEKGAEATPYSPYVANPIELCKIGDYKDKIYNDNGTWKVEKKISKVVLNGTETWTQVLANIWGSNSYLTSVTNAKAWGNTLSNYFKDGKFSQGAVLSNGQMQMAGSGIVMKNDSTTSANDFKTWLTTHNTELYYQLATPTTETITNTNLISQLNALYEFYVESSKVTISNNSEITLEVLLEYYGR